jgi:purine-binding chemotaxis protein CheW
MSENAIAGSGTYLSFTLGDEDFAVEITKVREVLDYPPITQVPCMPAHMRGVTNLRGNVVPVVDMRLKFAMSQVVRTVDACAVIVEVELDGEPMTVGCLVDSVKEVFEMTAEQIAPPPRMGTNINVEFLTGMGELDEKFLMILDIDKVLAADEIAAAVGITSSATETAEAVAA